MDALQPDSHLWAFEPSDENYSAAQITILLNKFKNVTLLKKGLGSQHEEKKILTMNTETGRALEILIFRDQYLLD